MSEIIAAKLITGSSGSRLMCVDDGDNFECVENHCKHVIITYTDHGVDSNIQTYTMLYTVAQKTDTCYIFY